MQEDNVKVAVRVRPLLPKEKLGGEQVCVRLVPNSNQVIVGKDRAFTFDFALSAKTTQEDTYIQCVEPLVRSIFEGYNSTVFAYGQTGSGKTYTIGGGDISSLTEDEYGIIPRALQQMFEIMKSNTHVTYDVRVSYVEIYKEELRDLLDLDTSSKDLHVREDDKGNTVIVGAQEEKVRSLDEVMSLLEAGSAARHTGSTQMNEHSSRSHSVFTVLIGQQWTEVDPMAEKRVRDSSDGSNDEIPHYMSGKFHFVDLAGSERAHRTGNVGDRFKESIHINSGLLSLGNVISSLGDPKKKSNHIPYRDSKITRLLKDSLGGNAKTVMICCISPASANFDETLNALKYANRARNIKNKPVINRDIQSIRFEEMQSEIMALREELARQRTCVQSAYSDSCPDHTAGHIKDLEQKINRLETECAHYRMIADEAYKQLTEIQGRDLLSKSLDVRLRDWLELMEEIKNRVPTTLSREDLQNETIKSLQSQLNKCRSDLKSDEEIFADKTREVKQLTEQLQELEQRAEESAGVLGDWQVKVQQQEQQLVQQQLRIQELEAALKVTTLNESSVMDSATVVSSIPPTSSRRPKSVPAHLHSTPDNGGGLRPPSRHVKTSPALFSVDRVMQSFRARSQLLVSRLEDNDEVLHQTFSDESGDDDDEAVVDDVPPEGALQRRGTYRVKKNKQRGRGENRTSVEFSGQKAELGELRSSTHMMEVEETESGSRLINVDVTSSTELQRKKIKQAQLKILEANQKVRDLSINIRMKEQLICELVKTGKDAELMNKQYAEKIKALEKEKEQARQEVQEVQAALQELEAKEQQETAEKQKLQHDYRKKMEAAKQKVTALQRRQKETEKVASFAHNHEKKIHDLESAVDRMKQQQELLQRKLKEEGEQKARLEREMQKEVQRVKELELRSEHQQKVLKRKTEEIAAVQRRLRSASTSSGSGSTALPPINGEEQDRMEEQRRHLDAEVERVLQERQKMLELQEELRKREAIVAKKEAMLAEKSELEIKKMRSSTLLNKERVMVSARLDSIEHRLEERCQELSQLPAEQRPLAKEEIQALKQKRDRLHQERQAIDSKLHEGKVLSTAEERRLIELEEGMEALDAAIQYKNDSINSRQVEIRQSQILAKSEDNLMNRLSSLTAAETRSMLSRYFDKVIDLREAERKLKLQCSEMEVKSEEMERVVHELENALHKSAFELDRRLTQQQQEYERKIHVLMHQLMVTEGTNNNSSSSSSGVGGGGAKATPLVNGDVSSHGSAKMQQLEKDLYYYKKTSRDMRKKIREMFNNGKITGQLAEEIGVSLVSNSVQSLADGEPTTPRGNPTANPPGLPHRGSATSLRSQHYHHQQPPTTTSTSSLGSHPAGPSLPSARHHHRASSQDPPSCSGAAAAHSATPVKISRKDLRVMSEEEVSMRRSNLSRSSASSPHPKDSLEGNRNPWD
ncbi:kinesin-like protein KIF27 [Babylonia areolata]|uniref:kinesin-like protein KIF27 n=1 Tax=Babylonia areolata TaxID=304850 RepID=UPI003FD52A6A